MVEKALFQPLKCGGSRCFSVSYHIKLNIFGFSRLNFGLWETGGHFSLFSDQTIDRLISKITSRLIENEKNCYLLPSCSETPTLQKCYYVRGLDMFLDHLVCLDWSHPTWSQGGTPPLFSGLTNVYCEIRSVNTGTYMKYILKTYTSKSDCSNKMSGLFSLKSVGIFAHKLFNILPN